MIAGAKPESQLSKDTLAEGPADWTKAMASRIISSRSRLNRFPDGERMAVERIAGDGLGNGAQNMTDDAKRLPSLDARPKVYSK